MYKFVTPKKEEKGAMVNRDFISFYVQDDEVSDVSNYMIQLMIGHTLMTQGGTPDVFEASDSMFECD